MKTCSRCDVEKAETEFFRQSSAKDGLQSHCKVCDNERSKAHRKANPEAHRAKKRRYYARHAYARERKAASLRAWKKRNRAEYMPKQLRYQRVYRVKREASDPAFKLRCRLSSRLHQVLKGARRASSTMELLGVTREELRAHIERQFSRGMTWANWGEVWHVDHIRPLCGFDLTDPEQLAQACHISNLRPLAKTENLAKGGRREFLL